MPSVIDKISSNELMIKYLDYVYSLEADQIKLIIVITALLIVVYAWKKFGYEAVIGLFLVYFFIYVLYTSSIFSNYEENDRNTKSYNMRVEKELNK